MFQWRKFQARAFVIICMFLLLIAAGCKKKPEDASHEKAISEKEQTYGKTEDVKSEEDIQATQEGETKGATMEKEMEKMDSSNPVLLIKTSLGDIKVELFPKEAEITVKNFLDYTNEKFFDGTIFHRVIPNFVIQGGGFTPDMNQKQTKPPIKNEATNGLKNKRGTLAMARTQIVDSATSQFFINLKDNQFLDHRDETNQGYGYCVFGRVIMGMDIVDKIAATPTKVQGRYRDVPVTPVIIESISLIE